MELGNTSSVKWFAGIAERSAHHALTRDFKSTVVARVERDPAFAKALLEEAATLFLSGEPETARLILRDLVNATIGFEGLAKATLTPSKCLKVGLKAQTVDAKRVA